MILTFNVFVRFEIVDRQYYNYSKDDVLFGTFSVVTSVRYSFLQIFNPREL